MVVAAARLQTPLARAGATERRGALRTLERWRLLRSGLAAPTLMDLQGDCEEAVWRDRFLLWRAENPAESTFVVCGAGAREALAMDCLGMRLSDALPEAGRAEIIAACNKATTLSQPVKIEGSFNATPTTVTLYRAIFMPVRALTDELGYIMGAIGAAHLEL